MALYVCSLTWLRFKRSYAVVTEVIEDQQPLFLVYATDKADARQQALTISGWHHRSQSDYSLTVRHATPADLEA